MAGKAPARCLGVVGDMEVLLERDNSDDVGYASVVNPEWQFTQLALETAKG